MATLRTLLIVLLCLALPMTGWASVADINICPAAPAKTLTVTDLPAHTHVAAHPHHEHTAAGKQVSHPHPGDVGGCAGKSCQHGCACGCGMGTCTSGFAALFGVQAAVALFAVRVDIAAPIAARRADSRGTSPLRPPIS